VSEKSKDEQEWEKTREFKVRYEEFLEKYANN
jgi:hypothetical protein